MDEKLGTDHNQLVGSRIRCARMAKGMSMEGLGKKLGVTYQQVQKYEKGKNRVSAEVLIALAEILECSVGFLLGEGAEIGEQEGVSEDKFILEALMISRIEDEEIQDAVLRLIRALCR